MGIGKTTEVDKSKTLVAESNSLTISDLLVEGDWKTIPQNIFPTS